ncbi:monosaccharide ABC transporter membrane protein (CUT2 family) [Homoserinimonas aerilata]|uniref:Monosaccharide ABC transporter membrane protein (CUT2 family) n=1 Tax=Homoserinimonas aerilata TaxID=1162970 RepID=A0A542YER8_9MICO|nr:ABC transporter permease [Homoserinimonas aerilata]TQL46562.1 monosaccharide ABC transporter membrane protein (CUT2 family) [Homoserinimonas aerilata]
MIARNIRRTETLVPLLAIVVVVLIFAVTAAATGRTVTIFDGYNMLQGLAQLGLLALALGITMIAGEFDVSVVGVSALGGMVAVQLGQQDPLFGVAAGVLAGLVVGLVQGTVIAKFRLSSMPVTIASYIALLGLTSVLSGGLSVTYTNVEASMWVDQTILGVLSPRSIIVLLIFVIVAVVLASTRLGPELRALGDDRRAARVSGVPVDRRLIGVFAVSGMLAALSGALLNFSYSSANPNPGMQPLVLAAVAALIGGVSLSGGRGSGTGLLFGALAVAVLSQTVVFAALPGFVTQLIFATFLALVVLADAPGLRDRIGGIRTRLRSRQQDGVTEIAVLPDRNTES